MEAARRTEPVFNRVRRNVFYSYVNSASQLVAIALLIPLFTRCLGREVYGELLVIVTISSGLLLGTLGLDQAFVNRIAEARVEGDDARVEAMVSTVFFTYLSVAGILLLALLSFSGWTARHFVSRTDPDAAMALFALGSLTALSLPLRTYAMLLRGIEAVHEERKLAAITIIGGAAVTVLALWMGYRLVAVATIQGIATIGAGVLAWSRVRVLCPGLRPRIASASTGLLRWLLIPSLWFAVMQASASIGFGTDNLVIGWVLGPGSVARYAIPYMIIVRGGAGIFATLASALLPTITATYARRQNVLLRSWLSLMMRFALLYAGIGAVFFWIAGPWIIRLWAGLGIFPDSTTFSLMIVLFVTQILIFPAFTILIATTRHYKPALVHVIEAFLNLSLSIWWAHHFGLPGVIAGTVVARLLTSAWYLPYAAVKSITAAQGLFERRLSAPLMLTIVASIAAFIISPRYWTSVRGPAPLVALGIATAFVLLFGWISFSADELRAGFNQVSSSLKWRSSS